LKNGFYEESVIFVTGLRTWTTSPYVNSTYIQARNVRFSRCLLSGDGRRATWSHKCPV